MKFSKRLLRLTQTVICFLIFSNSVKSQTGIREFGYQAKADSIEFIFGQQKKILIGTIVINLNDRFSEIKQVYVAGDFNSWNPKDPKYLAVMGPDKLFRLTVAKKLLGAKGETRQFKFVLNGVHWVEPPEEAVNRRTGSDGNTNLTLKL